MQRVTAERLLARLRSALARGATFRQAAAQLSVPRTTLHRWAKRYDLPRRRAGISPDTERQIKARLARGQSQARIHRETGAGLATVHRRHLKRLAEVINRATGEAFLPTKPWRCPTCGGLVQTNRCVADRTPKPAKMIRRS